MNITDHKRYREAALRGLKAHYRSRLEECAHHPADRPGYIYWMVESATGARFEVIPLFDKGQGNHCILRRPLTGQEWTMHGPAAIIKHVEDAEPDWMHK